MIKDTAYDTTVGGMLDMRNIEQCIKVALIQDAAFNQTLDVDSSHSVKPVFILGGTTSQDAIPFFAHPYRLQMDKDVVLLVSDLRPFIRSGELFKGMPDVKNKTEYNFVKSRAILNLAWLNGYAGTIKNELMFAGTVLSMWLSDVIAKKYALDPKDQMIISIVAHFYYQSLFTTEEWSEEWLQKASIHVLKATRAPSDLVYYVADHCHGFKSITDLCEVIKKSTENVRLDNFNTGMLLTIIANSWYGTNSREILPTALEHPPTWCAIVYASLTERTFKNSSIAKVTEKYAKHGNGDAFLKGYASLVRSFTVEKNISQEAIEVLPFE